MEQSYGQEQISIRQNAAGRDVGGHEVLAQHALAGTGLLDFGDDGGVASGHLGTQRADEIAHVVQLTVALLGLRAHIGQRAGFQSQRDLFVLDGDDLLQDVGHGCAF